MLNWQICSALSKHCSTFQNTASVWRLPVRHFEHNNRKPDPPVKCIFKLRASRRVLTHGLSERDCSYLLCLGLHSSSFISFTYFIQKPSFHSSSHGGSRGEPSGLAPLWMYSCSHNISPVSNKHHLWTNQTMRNSDPFPSFSVHYIVFDKSCWFQIALGFLSLAPFRSWWCHCSEIWNWNLDCFHPPQPAVCIYCE